MRTIVFEQPLTSNGFTLSTTPNRLGRLTPSDPAQPIEALRDQYREQGYLWLRGLLDRNLVFDFRRRYFTAMAETGLIAPGSDPIDGIYSAQEYDKLAVRNKVLEIVRWAAYEAFCLSPQIWHFYEAFLEGAPYLHKRKILRHTIPGGLNSTGAHYDLTYLRAGTDRVHSSWIPLGDIPLEMGGLVYLEGADAFGRQAEAEFARKNTKLSPEERISAYNKNMSETGWLTKDLPALADKADSRWLMADYEAGDMVIHSAYMIHAATTNVNQQGRMRLSTDIRYQLVTDEIDARWENHWSAGDML